MNAFATYFAVTIVAAPALLVVVLGLRLLVSKPLSEDATCRAVGISLTVGLLASLAMCVLMAVAGWSHVTVRLGNWISLPEFQFSFNLLFDWLSVPFLLLSFVLCGTIARFAQSYMHREPGFHRFFILFAIFSLGMTVTSLAENVETLFTGWELVGLSSALLVAFFQERLSPVRNGLRVWSVYRFSDAALLIAAVVLHGMRGHGDFDALFGGGPWPGPAAEVSSQQAFIVGVLILIAAAGKSALVPFSGWLPRAMEGPTPSSAVFYGALSVHLGVFLLLRTSPILLCSTALCILIVFLGLTTAAFAAITARVQTDIKSALSFASLTQVGIIVAEIGIGLRWIPLVHLMGHACLRTLQFVRAPTLLQDYRIMENAMGKRLPAMVEIGRWYLPVGARRRLYRWALERGYLDAMLDNYIVRPFLSVFRFFDARERNWTDLLSQQSSRESDHVRPHSDLVEELV